MCLLTLMKINYLLMEGPYVWMFECLNVWMFECLRSGGGHPPSLLRRWRWASHMYIIFYRLYHIFIHNGVYISMCVGTCGAICLPGYHTPNYDGLGLGLGLGLGHGGVALSNLLNGYPSIPALYAKYTFQLPMRNTPFVSCIHIIARVYPGMWDCEIVRIWEIFSLAAS